MILWWLELTYLILPFPEFYWCQPLIYSNGLKKFGILLTFCLFAHRPTFDNFKIFLVNIWHFIAFIYHLMIYMNASAKVPYSYYNYLKRCKIKQMRTFINIAKIPVCLDSIGHEFFFEYIIHWHVFDLNISILICICIKFIRED